MPNQSSIGYGTIFVVATPIGHLDDISKRAIDTLNRVDLIVAEDTRHSKKLLQAYQISTSMISFHTHNEQQKSQSILDKVKQGMSIALISDAGTPLISDPGYPLIKLAHEQQVTVSPVPGPCALTSALSVAGIPCQQFSFLGFLPHKPEAKQTLLTTFRQQAVTLACYESPHRVFDSLTCIEHVFGLDYDYVLIKELTKTFETIRHGNSQAHRQWLEVDVNHQKGEFILLLPPKPPESTDDAINLLTILISELPLKQAAQIAAKLTGKPKNALYQMALELKKAP